MHRGCLSLAGIVAAFCFAAAGDESPRYKITTKRDTDKVEVQSDKDAVTFAIHSPFGISRAVIARTGDTWPKAVALRLHLTGLESLRVSGGKATLHAAASVQAGKPHVRQWKDGEEETALDAKDKLWMDIRAMGGDGQPAKALPLKNGCFEVQLPPAFLASNPQEITVDWIDFYRN